MDFTESYDDTCSQVGLAARSGDLTLLKDLLEHGKDYCVKDNRGWFPIHEAASNGHTDCVTELLKIASENNEDPLEIWPQPFNIEDRSALVLSARNGHYETVQALVHLYKTNTVDSFCAIKAGVKHPIILTLLLDAFPEDLNKSDDFVASVLHLAVTEAPIESMSVLISRGSNIEVKDESGRTPLHCLCGSERDDVLDVVKFLVENGCDVHTSDDRGCSALYIATQSSHIDVMKFLISEGADHYQTFSIRDDRSCTEIHPAPICIAAEHGNTDALEYLMTLSDPIGLGNRNVLSPVISAVVGFRPECLRLLVEANYPADGTLPGGDVRAKFFPCGVDMLQYFSVMHRQCIVGKMKDWKIDNELLTILLEQGVKVTPVSHVGITMSMLWREHENHDLLRILIKYGVFEVEYGYSEVFQKLNTFLRHTVRFLHIDKVADYHGMLKQHLNLLIKYLPLVKLDVTEELKYHVDLIPVVPPLLNLCRCVIRTQLIQNEQTLHNIGKLPIPSFLVDKLMFKNEL